MLSAVFPAILIFFLQNVHIVGSLIWYPGTYALLKPKTGCPNGWKGEGWINQSTDHNNENSTGLHVQGIVAQGRVLRHFCIKQIYYGYIFRSWPTGQYCIYGKRNTQHSKEYIRMYTNRWSKSRNVYSFASVRYQSEMHDSVLYYIELYFSCQTSGNKKIPISLPITKPFYLLPYGSRECQQVKWMVATSEWIKYHTPNYKGYTNDQEYGTVPYHEIGDINHTGITMFYCYYQRCDYTLNDTKGDFQSPGFPGKYPDGQLCSWKIMVPDNQTVHIHFTNFSLYKYDKDCLQLYVNNSRIFEPKQAYFGHRQPFTITATSDVMFVFRSDEENDSTGFRADYTMFKTPERTTTAKPPTTTTRPTTTTQPTTEPITTQPPSTKQPTTKQPTTTESTITTFSPITITNDTVQFKPTSTKNTFHKNRHVPLVKKTSFCDETWKIVVMVIPLVVFILITVVIIDIICRYRYKKALKSVAGGSSADKGMVVNPTYGRGNLNLDQTADTVTEPGNAADEQPQSRDNPPDYEDLDYTQIDEIPQPRRSTKRQEFLVLEPVGNDTSSVFYHVLEPPKIESDGPQCHAREPVRNSAPDAFYTLEPPTDLNRPTYQNLSEVNHCTLNPIYEPAENSASLVEANKL